MQRRNLLSHLVAAATAFALHPISAMAASRPQREILAFYYGWYQTKAVSGQDAHWHSPGALNTPVQGIHDSRDTAIIAQHVQQAKDNGLTGFVASWWGQNDPTDQQLPMLLEAATHVGLKVCAYIENAPTSQSLAEQILYLYQRYAKHKQWLMLDGRPVIFLYDRVLQHLGLEGWKTARKLVEARAPGKMAFIATGNGRRQIAERAPYFDGVHNYDLAFYLAQKQALPWLWRRQFYKSWVKYQKGLRVTTATIMPGFDDRLVPDRPAPRPVVDRQGGVLFADLWKAAIAADPDWLLIVSFNEWHEGSEIQPSRQNGDRELQTCRRMSGLFR